MTEGWEIFLMAMAAFAAHGDLAEVMSAANSVVMPWRI